MAFDFPNSPTIGDTYNGYTWDGEKWVQSFNAPNQSGVIAIKVFTASGTYTPSANMTSCVIECVGGGAGGGGFTGVAGYSLGTGGGGSGSYSRSTKTAAQIGASQPVTIGAGGGNNASGAATSVGSLVTANGGLVSATWGGGAGGAAGIGDVALPGSGAGFGIYANPLQGYAYGGNGGVSAFGGAPAGPAASNGQAYNGTGASTGSGGSGACANNAVVAVVGGPGGNGVVVITEYGMTALSSSTIATGAVRFDLPQGLSANQQAQARSNIGALKKNYIINGAMMVSQENGTTVISSGYPVDQFGCSSGTSGTLSIAQVTSVTPAGSPNRIRFTVTAADISVGAGDLVQIIHIIEGLRTADLRFGSASARTITIQFGCKGPAGTYCVSVNNNGATRSYVAEFVIASGEANTDVVKSVTLTGDTTGTWLADNNKGLDVRWFLMGGSSFQTAPNVWTAGAGFFCTSAISNFMGTAGNVFELFDVSLTEGTIAPPFVVPDYASELAACMRYFYRRYFAANQMISTLQSYNTTTANGPLFAFPVTMRSAPTVTYSLVGHFTLQAPTGFGVALSAFGIGTAADHAWVSTATSSGLLAGNATALYANINAAWITASARL